MWRMQNYTWIDNAEVASTISQVCYQMKKEKGKKRQLGSVSSVLWLVSQQPHGPLGAMLSISTAYIFHIETAAEKTFSSCHT